MVPAQRDPRLIERDATLLFSQSAKVEIERAGLNFTGSSPPEVFVGRFNSPRVFAGILAPPAHEERANVLSAPEEWFSRRLSIDRILGERGRLVDGRFVSEVKSQAPSRLTRVMQEVSMASQRCDVEFFLKKKPRLQLETSALTNPVANPAPLERARLAENPKVERRVEQLVADEHVKARDAVLELYDRGFFVSQIMKVLSAGLLGIKKQRTLVPSRWSVTAVDDTVSKSVLEEIYHYPVVDQVLVFSDEYLGNHYEFILFPQEWSFEVIETKTGAAGLPLLFWRGYENVQGRKGYAESVTGAYYANRLAVVEYLRKVKRQAGVLVLREVRPEYYAPLGVGILREVSRSAFRKEPEVFESVTDALKHVQRRLKVPVAEFASRSMLLRERRTQTKLSKFF